MKYILIISIFLFSSIHPLQAQRKRKIKPVYHGKIQGGYLVDKVIPKGNEGYTYLNLGIRKVVGSKISEWGFETFYYKNINDREVVSRSLIIGTEQKGFGLNIYHYLMLKQWTFGKLKIEAGPQFSFNYYHNGNLPLATNNFPKNFNDFKLGGTARVELNYKIDERYSFILGTQYTLFQAGLRRIKIESPILTRREQLEDFLQFDLLVERYIAYIGVITQFGKVKVNRAKIAKKKEEERQNKQDKIAKKKAKKEKKKLKDIEKKKAKKEKKKLKDIKKNKSKKNKTNKTKKKG